MYGTYSSNPTLETVLMIEKAARKYSGKCGKYQLWKRLPKKVMYQSFQAALAYLAESNKVMIDRDGKIVWIWNPEGVKRLLREDLIVR